MIISVNVLNLSEQSPSRYRCTFNYVFDDGREINIKPSSVGTDYQAVAEAKAPSILQSIMKSDAQDAFNSDIRAAHGYASQSQVFYEYLYAGFNEADPVAAFEAMNGTAQVLLGLGLTTAQLADMLGETVEMAQDVIDRWTLLEANQATILAYKAVREAM